MATFAPRPSSALACASFLVVVCATAGAGAQTEAREGESLCEVPDPPRAEEPWAWVRAHLALAEDSLRAGDAYFAQYVAGSVRGSLDGRRGTELEPYWREARDLERRAARAARRLPRPSDDALRAVLEDARADLDECRYRSVNLRAGYVATMARGRPRPPGVLVAPLEADAIALQSAVAALTSVPHVNPRPVLLGPR